MADASVTVGALRERVRAFVRARDWEAYHNPKDLAIALSVEASEFLERFLWGPPPDPTGLSAQEREALEDELADVVIYALHLADVLGTDLSEAVLRKVTKNEAKYPVERVRGTARPRV